MRNVIVSWSGGKDCSLALYEVQRSGKYHVSALLATITEGYDRVSMHGVRRTLIEKQAENLNIPLHAVFIPKKCSNKEYGEIMKKTLLEYKERGTSSVVFGDIFLEDVRRYREENLSKVGMKGIFPLWKKNTLKLAKKFINLGFKAIVTCVNSKILDKNFVGRIFNGEFLDDLPSNVDPCGENGEFHTFVFDGPIFRKKVFYRKGKIVLRNSFYFCDLLPV